MSHDASASAAPTPDPSIALHGPATTDTRSFYALLATMFQGAMSDNIFKFFLTMMLTAQAAREALKHVAAKHAAEIDTARDAVEIAREAIQLTSYYKTIVDILTTLPWILAVAFAGWLADRFPKNRVTQWTKLLELGLMFLAIVTLYWENVWASVAVLVLMYLQAALFSPAKYGILPEMMPESRLGWGNGILQGATFAAIVVGTIIGPWLYHVTVRGPGMADDILWVGGVVLVVLALIGMATAAMLRPLPAADPHQPMRINPFPMIVQYTRVILADTGLKWGMLGLIVWWMAAAMMFGAIILMATTLLGLDEQEAGLALLPIVIGQGIGCVISGMISRDRIELGQVPLGAIGMFFTCGLVWLVTPVPEVWATISDAGKETLRWVIPMTVGFVGFTTGFFIVPLEAFVVHTSDPKVRGGVWAVGNVLTAFGQIAGFGLQFLIVNFWRANAGDVFLVGGILMLVTCAIICVRFPKIPLRFMILVCFRSFYSTRAKGVENIPTTGGALLIANHQSFLDGILLATVVDRPIRFVMSAEVSSRWYVKPFAKITKSIAIEQSQSPRELIAALRAASEEIAAGGLVCIFPEGQLSRNGMLMPFRRGVERIMKDLDAPIVPIAIDGAYDTAWGMRDGVFHFGFVWPPRRATMRVVVGKSLPAKAPLHELRQHVEELMVDAFEMRKATSEILHRMALKSLRRDVRAKLYSDHNSEEMQSNATILGTIGVIGARMKPHWRDEATIGIVLPPAIGSLGLNIVALAAGKLPVNLNYTSSPQIIAETCEIAGIRLIIASRVFLEKLKLELPKGIKVLYTEDLREGVSQIERIAGFLRAYLMPMRMFERWLGRRKDAEPDDLATLIFSSGSTGTPKGVMLSNWNIYSNIVGALYYINLPKNPRLLGVLPFFHSFGYLAALWLPFKVRGMGVSFYPNPLDAKVIGNLVEKYRVTHLFGTPTFLSTYTRRVESGQFGSLVYVITGAEKLKTIIADGFEQQFGIRPKEGFGATETSPVVSLNGYDLRLPGVYQQGAKRGTVGHPIPGVAVRIVDLDTGELMPPGETGMLLVRGPNIMKGYYKAPEKTAEAMVDGVWYRTGDIAKVDEQGFITITDRLSRFSKIGGEMVPHIRIEEALQNLSGEAEPVVAVAGIPDEKKGERIVVLYTVSEARAKEICDGMTSPELNLPPLWIPRWADFVKVEKIPMLGSGKMDLREIKATAMKALEGKREKATVQG